MIYYLLYFKKIIKVHIIPLSLSLSHFLLVFNVTIKKKFHLYHNMQCYHTIYRGEPLCNFNLNASSTCQRRLTMFLIWPASILRLNKKEPIHATAEIRTMGQPLHTWSGRWHSNFFFVFSLCSLLDCGRYSGTR